VSGPSQIRAHRFRLVTLALLSLIAFAGPAAASPALDAAAVTDLPGTQNPAHGMHGVASQLHSHAVATASLTTVECEETAEKTGEEVEKHGINVDAPSAVPRCIRLAPTPEFAGVLFMLSRLRACPGRGPPHA